MVIHSPGHQTSGAFVERVMARRADAVSRAERRAELLAEIGASEDRFGIDSSSVHLAIERGELTETRDVCRWLMDIDLLKHIEA